MGSKKATNKGTFKKLNNSTIQFGKNSIVPTVS